VRPSGLVASARGEAPAIVVVVSVGAAAAGHRERHEGARGLRCEDDVRRFVADEDRAGDAHRGEVDDADRVRDLVDDPRVTIRARAHRDGINADRDRAAAHGEAADQVEHFKLTIRGVDGEERGAVGRHLNRVGLRRLEVREVPRLREGGRCGKQAESQAREGG
jgi:hypothetical protein